MKQYYQVKNKYPDAILLFRVGDFYETFEQDAIKTSEILGITLTKRANGSASYVELAGFPHHALDNYLPKLVRAGERVAICDQLEDPKLTKKIVKRGVTELVTPGVSLNDNVLEHKENNFLASVFIDKTIAGIAFLDISTGEFYTAEGNFEYIDKLLQSFGPKEVLYEKQKKEKFYETFGSRHYLYPLDEWIYEYTTSRERLLNHFETTSLKGFGIEGLDRGILAAGAILHYLDATQHHNIKNITGISRIDEDKYVWLDRFTIRNLEIFNSMQEGGKSLINVVDRSVSPMGSRLLKRWLALPLKHSGPIEERLDIVQYFIENEELHNELEEHIRKIGDIERLISKVAVMRISPREVSQLRASLQAIEPVKNICDNAKDANLRKIGEQINVCKSIRERLEKELQEDPPAQVNKGNVIAGGVNPELDELREMSQSARTYMNEMQEREIKRTGIPSLKIAYNNVFGYYIEVRNTHKDKVPEEWIRKQTLVSAERYITEELKEFETKILGAEEKILALETRLFNELIIAMGDYVSQIQMNAVLLARIDVLMGFARLAVDNKYNRPGINEGNEIKITNGRHPVIETQMEAGEEYIANDVLLDDKDQQIVIITGPNMAGKSALLRQTALITLLSQVGSFVPAEKAEIGVVDKIFTRVGASDNISAGESTFMVEMNEAASILNNISSRSLVLLDELGRGTSTYDGISLAWAIVEYLHEHPKHNAKTLFATHYHELNEMEKTFKRIKNFNVSVREVNNKIVFLRKLVRGGSAHSFGIHVAQMAGMPPSVVQRAEKILKELEQARNEKGMGMPTEEITQNREGMQLSFFQLDDPVLQQIRDQISQLDVNNLTPVEALNKLNEIKKIAGL
ncbi:DNA mismatch repair protein MutS [Salinivirga cyanobacteriivorans]|uniref:DNA mismatch repair protein MutS n=1 Tax=Salinivirga cyanobacteriivorans TaxID=1307839 RepID=A0A0S2HZK2_9BACT|nr:DNA mismatch repair protein MutS [Salinivirga cyanobacteriivorans]ALO15438.1 DNA mismatch repair protein MutS [Salinivirga cyanobacteriivorans]